MAPRTKKLLTDLAWLPVVAGNAVGTYLVFLYIGEQLRAADSSPVGNLVAVEVFILWAAFELTLVAVLAVRRLCRR